MTHPPPNSCIADLETPLFCRSNPKLLYPLAYKKYLVGFVSPNFLGILTPSDPPCFGGNMWKPPALGPLVRVLRGDFGLALGVRQGEDHRTLGDLALLSWEGSTDVKKRCRNHVYSVHIYIYIHTYIHTYTDI